MKREVTYAFIDSQNLNLGTRKNIYKKRKKIYTGWHLDFGKFYKYLENKFKIKKAFLFIGFVKKNKKLYKYLTRCGYVLVYKPTVKNKNGIVKGNVDAELVLYASAIMIDKYDKAVVVSGDGDFACLYKYLEEKNKLKALIIPNKKSASSLLNNFNKYKILLEREKTKLKRE